MIRSMRQTSLALILVTLLGSQLYAADSTFRAGDSFTWHLAGMPEDVIRDIANLQYTVGPEGTVNVPHIGKVKAAGLNATQLADSIQAKFVAGKFFTSPTVIINPVPQQRFVSVSGAVRQSGLLWSDDMTISSAIGNAGDPGDFSDPTKITVARDGKILGPYNLKQLRREPAKDIKLQPGDQVVVPGH
jgi:polysaccharide export outer membrane protein